MALFILLFLIFSVSLSSMSRGWNPSVNDPRSSRYLLKSFARFLLSLQKHPIKYNSVKHLFLRNWVSSQLGLGVGVGKYTALFFSGDRSSEWKNCLHKLVQSKHQTNFPKLVQAKKNLLSTASQTQEITKTYIKIKDFFFVARTNLNQTFLVHFASSEKILGLFGHNVWAETTFSSAVQWRHERLSQRDPLEVFTNWSELDSMRQIDKCRQLLKKKHEWEKVER